MKNCEKCGGTGVINLPDDKLIECECSLIRRIAAKMPSHIRMTKVSKRHLSLPILNMTKESLFVISRWADMRAVIKSVIIRNYKMNIQITSDREIRDVGVGSTSRSARADDDIHAVYNSISDLVDMPDLTIIRLNELKYKNKAASGLLEEAITYRIDRMKPTWVVSDPTDPFGMASHAFSQSVWDLLHTCFDRIEIPQILSIPTAPDAPRPIGSSRAKTREETPVLELDDPIPELASKYESKPKPGTNSYRKKDYSEDDTENSRLLNTYGSNKTSKKNW